MPGRVKAGAGWPAGTGVWLYLSKIACTVGSRLGSLLAAGGAVASAFVVPFVTEFVALFVAFMPLVANQIRTPTTRMPAVIKARSSGRRVRLDDGATGREVVNRVGRAGADF